MEELICIRCPIGCTLTCTKTDDGYQVTGNTCKRGYDYAIEEMTHPRRIVTTIVRVDGSDEPLSVKTSSPVGKELIDDVIKSVKSLVLKAPVNIGDILIKDVLGTGADIVATKSII